MRTWWKVAIGVVLVVPLLAYVVGPLTPSDAGRGDRTRPVIIGDVRGTVEPAPPASDDGDDDSAGAGDTDEERPRVNVPEPRRLEEPDGQHDDGEEGSGQRDDTDDTHVTNDGADDSDDDDDSDDGSADDGGDNGSDDD